MKIFSASQIRAADAATIAEEGISSLALMERAASAATSLLLQISQGPFIIYCGQGHNGGDGLVMARLLQQKGYRVRVAIFAHSAQPSPDFEANLKAYRALEAPLSQSDVVEALPLPERDETVVDALLGSGLDRPLRGPLADLVRRLNQAPAALRCAVDIPTGLPADGPSGEEEDKIFRADHCLSFQWPKRSFFHLEGAPWVGEWHLVDIGLSPKFYRATASSEHYVEAREVAALYRPRSRYTYKNRLGHAYLLAGSEGKAGAALLAAEAALRSGCGLLTAGVPSSTFSAFNQRLPEAMLLPGSEDPPLQFTAYGVGPGLSRDGRSKAQLKRLLQEVKQGLVLDAEALNILADNRTWLEFLPPQTILTPHPGECLRLLGKKQFGPDYWEELRQFALRYRCILVMKAFVNTIATPQGELFFTNFGTPALAKGGSGDVFTGIVLSLLAQSYPPLHAVLVGLFLHGSAARAAEAQYATETVLASDISAHLHSAFAALRDYR